MKEDGSNFNCMESEESISNNRLEGPLNSLSHNTVRWTFQNRYITRNNAKAAVDLVLVDVLSFLLVLSLKEEDDRRKKELRLDGAYGELAGVVGSIITERFCSTEKKWRYYGTNYRIRTIADSVSMNDINEIYVTGFH